MTELLYLHDSYLREFDATVGAQGGQAVVLDRQAFFIGGGGQPADVGLLRWAGRDSRVGEIRKDADGVWLVLEATLPSVGTPVHATVEWECRFCIMRHHSALHVLV